MHSKSFRTKQTEKRASYLLISFFPLYNTEAMKQIKIVYQLVVLLYILHDLLWIIPDAVDFKSENFFRR